MKNRYSLIIVALLVSLFIYLFYRTEKTVVNELVIRMISLDNYVALKKAIVRFLPLHKLIIYSLPEGLWVFCITLTSKPYYIQYKDYKIRCVVIPFLFCIGLEICQLLHFTRGYFDYMDIVMSGIFWLIVILTFGDKSDKQNIVTPLTKMKLVSFASYGIVYLSHVMK